MEARVLRRPVAAHTDRCSEGLRQVPVRENPAQTKAKGEGPEQADLRTPLRPTDWGLTSPALGQLPEVLLHQIELCVDEETLYSAGSPNP